MQENHIKPTDLTIGMLTYDDFDGVFFTINSIRMYHPEVLKRIHFVVIDNNPDGPHGKAIGELCQNTPNITLHQIRGVSSTSFRNLVFELAPTDNVLCLDSHVMMVPGSIDKLIKFYDSNPDFHDLIQGPLIAECGTLVGTSMLPTWRGGNFGIWDVDERGVDPQGDMFEIPMQGMGMFACTRMGWPRFTAGMRYFGAEEGTIHEKFRLMGRKCWCFPFLRWLHRFGRPGGATYRNYTHDKVWNYLLTFNEAQLPLATVRAYFQHQLDPDPAKSIAAMDELMHRAELLPLSPFPSPQHIPFLGKPISIVRD